MKRVCIGGRLGSLEVFRPPHRGMMEGSGRRGLVNVTLVAGACILQRGATRTNGLVREPRPALQGTRALCSRVPASALLSAVSLLASQRGQQGDRCSERS